MNLRRMIGAGVGALILGGLAAVAVAQPVAATPPSPSKVCPTWQLRGATGKYPDIVWGEPGKGSKVTAGSVTMVKPADGVDPGVEFAAKDVDLPAGTITVKYALTDGADFAATSVRLFFFTAAGADTLGAPSGSVAATAMSGTLTLTAAEPIGTIGLVYDSSNPSSGKVTFSDLRVDTVRVKFKNVCTSPSPTASASPSESVSPSPSAPSSSDVSPSQSPAAGGNGGGDATGGEGLPVTGSNTAVIASAGVGLLAIGGVLFLVTRMRRRTFSA